MHILRPSNSKGSFHFKSFRLLFIHAAYKLKPYKRLRCIMGKVRALVLLRVCSGCLGDSLLEADRGAASSPAYMKPLEVNFLIKSPHCSTLNPTPPPTCLKSQHICELTSCSWDGFVLHVHM